MASSINRHLRQKGNATVLVVSDKPAYLHRTQETVNNVCHAAPPEHFIRNVSHFGKENLLISPCFPAKQLWSESGLFSPSCLRVIAPTQMGVIYACFWNNQSCLSRALEPPGSESFCNEFWFAKSPSNLFPQFSTNIKTNSPFLCHKLLDLGEGEGGRGCRVQPWSIRDLFVNAALPPRSPFLPSPPFPHSEKKKKTFTSNLCICTAALTYQ